jgi:hypothetical protein
MELNKDCHTLMDCFTKHPEYKSGVLTTQLQHCQNNAFEIQGTKKKLFLSL